MDITWDLSNPRWVEIVWDDSQYDNEMKVNGWILDDDIRDMRQDEKIGKNKDKIGKIQSIGEKIVTIVDFSKWVKDIDKVAGSFIWALKDMQTQLKQEFTNKWITYPNWLNENAEKLAIKMWVYKPKNMKDSLIVYPWNKLQFKNWKLIFERKKWWGEITIYDKKANKNFDEDTFKHTKH